MTQESPKPRGRPRKDIHVHMPSINLRLPPELRERLTGHASETRQTISEAVRGFIERGLAAAPPPRSAGRGAKR